MHWRNFLKCDDIWSCQFLILHIQNLHVFADGSFREAEGDPPLD